MLRGCEVGLVREKCGKPAMDRIKLLWDIMIWVCEEHRRDFFRDDCIIWSLRDERDKQEQKRIRGEMTGEKRNV